MWPIHDVRIQLDAAGAVLGATVVSTSEDGSVRVSPQRTGPFDTPEETLERCKLGIALQLTLW